MLAVVAVSRMTEHGYEVPKMQAEKPMLPKKVG